MGDETEIQVCLCGMWEQPHFPIACEAARRMLDPEYADVAEDGQLSVGVAGDQRAIPGLRKPVTAEG